MKPLVVIVGLLAASLAVPMGSSQFAGASLSSWTKLETGADNRLTPVHEIARGIVVAEYVTTPLLGTCIPPLEFRFSVARLPVYGSMTLNPAVVTQALRPGENKVVATTEFFIATTRDAPAFGDDAYEIRVDVSAPPIHEGCTLESATSRAMFTVKNDYVPNILVGETGLQVTSDIGSIQIPVQNTANGPTVVKASWAARDSLPFGALATNELHLESRATNGPSARDSGILEIHYQLREPGVVQLPITIGAKFDGPDLGTNTTSVPLVVNAESRAPASTNASEHSLEPQEVATAPGASLAFFVAVAAASLAVARRRLP